MFIQDAIIEGVAFVSDPTGHVTKEMIYSTRSYQDRRLGAVEIINDHYYHLNFRGFQASNQTMEGSHFKRCDLQTPLCRGDLKVQIEDSDFVLASRAT